MLVLSRKPGEKICLGTDLTITVLEVRGNRVRIGIEGPAHVAIRRGELPSSPPAPPDPGQQALPATP